MLCVLAHLETSPRNIHMQQAEKLYLSLLCGDGSEVLLGLDELGLDGLSSGGVGILAVLSVHTVLGGKLSQN